MKPTTPVGVGAALPTLRDNHGRIDRQAQERLAEKLCGQGAATLLLAGTTGGGGGLTHPERLELLQSSNVGVPLVCGVPAKLSEYELEEISAHANAALIAFETETVEEMLRTAERVREHEMEILAYHHPTHHRAIPDAWYPELAAAKIPVKNSDPERRVLENMRTTGIHALIGSTARLGDLQEYGQGVLSGVASIRFAEVYAAAHGDEAAHQALLAWERDTTNRVQAITDAAWQMVR